MRWLNFITVAPIKTLQSLELKGTEYFKMAALLAGIYLFFLSGKIKTHWKLSRKAKVKVLSFLSKN